MPVLTLPRSVLEADDVASRHVRERAHGFAGTVEFERTRFAGLDEDA